MVKPKVLVQKKRMLKDGIHWRFYKVGMFALDPDNAVNKYDGKRHPVVTLNGKYLETEKELASWLYHGFGEGEYLISALARGRRGLYVFWKGVVDRDGFIFHLRHIDKRDLREAESNLKDAQEAGDTDAIHNAQEEINFIKTEIIEPERKQVRYGFHPFLKRSSQRGQFTMWDAPDAALVNEGGDIYG